MYTVDVIRFDNRSHPQVYSAMLLAQVHRNGHSIRVYNARTPIRPTAPARPMPARAVGMAAPAEEDEDEPLEPDVAEAPLAPPEVEAPPAVEVPRDARETTELFWEWMLARMLLWPALMAVELWEMAVAFGAAVILAELSTELSAAPFVTAGTR